MIGLADGAATRIGRPTFDMFCFIGSIPAAVAKVAIRSGTETGRSRTEAPSSLVLPTTCPVRIPPPASATDQAAGQWSRPALLLIFGVRPNSPWQTTRVVSSNPRSLRSASREANASSSAPQRSLTRSKLF